MIYGYNNKGPIIGINGSLNESGKVQPDMTSSVNIKSQKQVGGPQIPHGGPPKDGSLYNIRKEKDRIN